MVLIFMFLAQAPGIAGPRRHAVLCLLRTRRRKDEGHSRSAQMGHPPEATSNS